MELSVGEEVDYGVDTGMEIEVVVRTVDGVREEEET